MSTTSTTPSRWMSPPEGCPARQPGSVRRTSSIDALWLDGHGGPVTFHGVCRDLLTDAHGEEQVLDAVSVDVVTDAARTIQQLETAPPRPGLEALEGIRAGGGLRRQLAEVIAAEKAAGHPLYLLLDDLGGVTLVASFVWTQWPERITPQITAGMLRSIEVMEDVCSGYRAGSSALSPDATKSFIHKVQPATPLARPDDPMGWHELAAITEPTLRRARRIDVTRLGDDIVVDSHFQDSCTHPTQGRLAVHEYTLTAVADAASQRIRSLQVTPHVLPFNECPLAVSNVDRLIGVPLGELRTSVLEQLPGTLGCTHLNDMLRSLAEAPALAARLI